MCKLITRKTSCEENEEGCSFILARASSLSAGHSEDIQAKMDFISLKAPLKPCMTTKDTVHVERGERVHHPPANAADAAALQSKTYLTVHVSVKDNDVSYVTQPWSYCKCVVMPEIDPPDAWARAGTTRRSVFALGVEFSVALSQLRITTPEAPADRELM
ncbi:hypothetical protein llap_18345 [Limosa lapponica baueri]|uniref:Uncharacterized protein n=1 Tax=Limosa lapponica baueri TaxID=1758121 RepID=A0A2I0TC21_LIMLA|nr:hypothetical protein llap_18345 [Limosa lapponica baueri]